MRKTQKYDSQGLETYFKTNLCGQKFHTSSTVTKKQRGNLIATSSPLHLKLFELWGTQTQVLLLPKPIETTAVTTRLSGKNFSVNLEV